MIRPHIQIDGLREVQADIQRQGGKLPAATGEFHKKVGQFVVDNLPPGDPHAVGEGAGSKVRASSTRREVLLRVGGGHRIDHRDPWGKKRVQPFVSGRPFIVGTVEEHQEEIEDMYMAGIIDVLAPAFASAE